MHSLLFDSVDIGATVVTVNSRLARSLRSLYHRRQVERGLAAWRTPAIVSFDVWCATLWSDLVDAGYAGSRVLPNSAQESAIWERIVDESPEGHGLIQTHRTAELARDAWHLAASWAIEIPEENSNELNEDCRAFVRWSKRYEREAEARGWVDRARLPLRLIEAIDAGIIETPTALWLAGFSEHTPQQQALIDAVERAGARVQQFVAPRYEADVRAFALRDGDDELHSAAQWTRTMLEGGAASVGIVVPDLQSRRARVDAILSDYLLPSAILPQSAELVRPFNISSGRPLADYPVVATALIAIELCTDLVPIERVGALLRSPFIGGATDEVSQRALLDARLRRRGRTAVRASEIRASAVETAVHHRDKERKSRTHNSPELALRLRDFEAAARAHAVSERHRPSTWAAAFVAILQALSWPGDRVGSTAEHQTLEKWWDLLSTYASLDGVIGDEAGDGAVRRLARMAADIDFQPRTDDAPVQILGTLEAAGMRFDHLWIVGMHDEEMPATPKPNPFLPLKLQRTHRVARASAERELQFARLVVDGLLSSAPDVIVSYPLSDGERQLVPSPLIAHITPQHRDAMPFAGAELFATIVQASALDPSMRESIADHTGPAVAPGSSVRGGTGIIKDQAACAFRAFAHHRLGARPLERPASGLDAMERGHLMHSVLELLWTELGDHAGLIALDDGERDALIERHVDAAIAMTAETHPETFSARFAAIERQRLTRITRASLELERERAPFRVDSIEADEPIRIGGIDMMVRIDRIDVLSDGRKVFLDYKTSQPKYQRWFGDRPDEPQLPIYCTSCDNVAAVAFIQLRANEVKFIGIESDSGILPGKPSKRWMVAAGVNAWEEVVPAWRHVLTNIGEQFLRGDAAVMPKHPKDTCKYCQIGPLCRVRDLAGDLDDAEDGDGA